MGTFAGHAVPGFFFMVISLWWTWAIWIRYFHARQRASPQPEGLSARRKWASAFRSQATFPCRCKPDFPAEGTFKVLAAFIGITGELVTAFKNGRFVHMMNLQHMVMFFFYGLNGAVDVMVSAGVPLPPDTDYATMVLALLVEGLLFYFHLHGRTPLDVHVHSLLTLVIAASALVVLLEMKFRHQPLCPLFRTVATLLQGTWFLQVGFILYNPIPGSQPWKEHSHDQMMIVTALFTGHLAFAVIFVGISGALASCWSKRIYRLWDKDIPFQALNNNSKMVKTKERTTDVRDESSDYCQ